ncbi:MAG: hypothetical protein IJJ98_01325, partial [Prevotella sp.]|nr:hypothetical protein [Prevotella sp.]
RYCRRKANSSNAARRVPTFVGQEAYNIPFPVQRYQLGLPTTAQIFAQHTATFLRSMLAQVVQHCCVSCATLLRKLCNTAA